MNSEVLLIGRQRQRLDSYVERIHTDLDAYPHAYWVTHDFRKDVDYSEGLRMVDGWFRHNARIASAHLKNNTGYEPDHTSRRFSCHSIILSDVELDEATLKKTWKAGHLHCEPFRKDGEAIEYTFRSHLEDIFMTYCPVQKPCRKNRKGRLVCSHQAGTC
jgi:hypothetical protein